MPFAEMGVPGLWHNHTGNCAGLWLGAGGGMMAG